MMRTSVMAAIVLLGGQAMAAPDPEPAVAVHWFGMGTTEAALGGFGAGGELALGNNAITIDASVVGFPVCIFGGCVLFYGAGGSLAYHRQITERFFVGPRIATRFVSTLPGLDSDDSGWMKAVYLEGGARQHSSRWRETGALGVGVSVWPDGGLGVALAVRATIGR